MSETLSKSLNDLTLKPTAEKGKISVDNLTGVPIEMEIHTDDQQRIKRINFLHPKDIQDRCPKLTKYSKTDKDVESAPCSTITREELFGMPEKDDDTTKGEKMPYPDVDIKIEESSDTGLRIKVQRPPSVYEMLKYGCMLDSEDPYHLCFTTCHAPPDEPSEYNLPSEDASLPNEKEQVTPDDIAEHSEAKLQ